MTLAAKRKAQTRGINKLSETKIRSFNSAGVYGDGGGLFLRVRQSGSKSWIFVYKRHGARKEIALGGYGLSTAPVDLKIAREKAENIRQELARGSNPLADKRVAADHAKAKASAVRGRTFKLVMDEVLSVRLSGLKNEKHRAQWRMTLNQYAAPLHSMLVAKISVSDVKDCLLPHWLARPETADRLRSRIMTVLDFALAHEWRALPNPATKILMSAVMPSRILVERHHAALSYSDAPAVMKKLLISNGVASKAVAFMAMTAARTGEVRGATWQEVDLANAIWTIPASRMKAKREHRVPLSTGAIEVLASAKHNATDDHLFPISATAMTKALRSASIDKSVTLHGLRSSFRDWAGDQTAHERDVMEAALAHAVGNATEAAYRRSDALRKRRLLMQDWAEYLAH